MSQNGTNIGTLGEAVRSIRTSLGWSQSILAKKADCAVSAVVDLERGNNGTMLLLDRLVSALQARWTGLPRGQSLADRVAIARQDADVSIAKLAQLAGVSKGAVLRLEQGTARVATLQAVLPFIAPGCGIKGPNIFRSVRSSGHQDVRFTPRDTLDKLIGVLGPIGLDPCGDPESFVPAKQVFTESDDGLQQLWSCKSGWVFVNPPFSKTAAFVRKGVSEWEEGRAKRIVFLLKSQTHGRFVQDLLHPVANILFLRDRLGFARPDGAQLTEARFGIMLVSLGVAERDVLRLTRAFPCMHLQPHARSVTRDRRAS